MCKTCISVLMCLPRFIHDALMVWRLTAIFPVFQGFRATAKIWSCEPPRPSRWFVLNLHSILAWFYDFKRSNIDLVQNSMSGFSNFGPKSGFVWECPRGEKMFRENCTRAHTSIENRSRGTCECFRVSNLHIARLRRSHEPKPFRTKGDFFYCSEIWSIATEIPLMNFGREWSKYGTVLQKCCDSPTQLFEVLQVA